MPREPEQFDAFGGSTRPAVYGTPAKPKNPQANGYAAPPGTGPDGETCGTCTHCIRHLYQRTFYKCGSIYAPRHTHSVRTDIRVRSPACKHWERAT